MSVQLTLLGSPSVTVAGRPAKLYSKAVALLAYLALEGRTARRDLAALLWPGASDALNNVSVTRSHILAELGDVLEADLETLALSGAVQCDALEFRADPQKASALYQGDFLAGLRLREWKRGLGLEFEEWIEGQRSRFNTERLDAATALGQTAIASRDYIAATRWLEIAISNSSDPREDAARMLMLACGATGQADRAVAVFQRLAAALEDCLGIAPSAETIKAFELARGEGRDACKRALGVRQPLSKGAIAPPKANPLHAQFVGRDAQLHQGLSALHLVNADKAQATMQVLVVTGEAGAGKSRFARELLGLLDDTQLIVAGATASATPFELLSNLTRSLGITALDEADSNTTLGLEARFLTLRNAIPDSAVVLLEDLHWADESALSLLTFLVAHPPASGLRIVVTHRPALQAIDALERCLAGIPSHIVQRIKLEPLDIASLERLAAQLNRSDVDAAWLRKASGGNALYALELMRSEAGVTRPVLELIRARVAQLGSPEQQVLESLAILDGEADLQRLQRVTGGHRVVLTTATQLLEREGLVRHGADVFALNHDLTREALLLGLNGSRLALLHLRAARATRGSDDVAALHYWASRSVWEQRDHRAARRAFEVLTDRCASHGNLPQALEWLERTLSISESPAEKARVMLKRAEWLARYSRGDQALETLQNCAKELIDVPEAELHAQSELIRARVLLRERNDPSAAKQHLETALVRIAGLHDRRSATQRGDALMLLGFAVYRLGDTDSALRHYNASLELRQKQGDQLRIAEVLNNIATTHIAQGDLLEAEQIFLRVKAIYEGLHHHTGLLGIFSNLANVTWQLGQLERAMEFIEQGMSIHSITGDEYVRARLEEIRGAILFLRLEYQASLTAYENALSIHVRHGHAIEAELNINAAEALHRLGRLSEAAQHLEQARADLLQRHSLGTPLALYGDLLHADVLTDAGDLNGAYLQLERIAASQPSTFRNDAKLRLSALRDTAAQLEALLTQHAAHPDYSYHLARALAGRYQRHQPARNLLEQCQDPYWQRQLSDVTAISD